MKQRRQPGSLVVFILAKSDKSCSLQTVSVCDLLQLQDNELYCIYFLNNDFAPAVLNLPCRVPLLRRL